MGAKPKLRIKRSENLNKITTNISADEGKRKLLAAGYGLVRTAGGHRIFKRGDNVITLWSTGSLSPWQTQLVIKAAQEVYDTRGVYIQDKIPLTVSYQGEVYSVKHKTDSSYRLINLDNGNERSVPISECKSVTLEIPVLLPKEEVHLETEGESLEEHKPEPVAEQPAPAPLPPMQLMTGNAREAWIKQSQKYLEALDVRYEQLDSEIRRLETERSQLRSILNIISGHNEAAPPLTRRIVLPSAGGPSREPVAHRRGGPRVPLTQADKDQILHLAKQGMGPMDIGLKMGRPQSTVSNELAKFRLNGQLPPGQKGRPSTR